MPLMTLELSDSTCCPACTILVVWCLVLHGRVSRVVLVLVGWIILAYGAVYCTFLRRDLMLTCRHSVRRGVDTIEDDDT